MLDARAAAAADGEGDGGAGRVREAEAMGEVEGKVGVDEEVGEGGIAMSFR